VTDDSQEKTAKPKRRLLPGLTVREGYTRHPFDLEFGVRTSGLIAGRHLGSGHKHDRHNTAYYAVAPSVFHAMIVRWRRCHPRSPIDAYTFVDLGAGMGRAVLLAAEYPFRQAVGVELNPTLARIARRNTALWRKAGRARAPIRILCRDAVDFRFPASPCLAFLFNPFGAPVMRRLLGAMAASFVSRAGQLEILYVNNEQEDVLKGQPGFAPLFTGQVRRSPADAIADHKILANQPDGVYAAANYEDCSIYRWVGTARPEKTI
jgi:SAM-dependent methyltransferase